MARESGQSWEDWIAWASEVVDDQVTRWGIDASEAEAFKARLRDSKTMRELASGPLPDQVRCRLSFAALVDALLEPTATSLRKSGFRVPVDSPEGEELVVQIAVREEAVQALRKAGDDDLADKAEARLEFDRSALVRKSAGAPLSLKYRVTYALEGVLRVDNSMKVTERRELIARLVSEFVEPVGAVQLKWAIEAQLGRDRRAGRTATFPVAGGLARKTLEALGRAPEDLVADHFSGLVQLEPEQNRYGALIPRDEDE